MKVLKKKVVGEHEIALVKLDKGAAVFVDGGEKLKIGLGKAAAVYNELDADNVGLFVEHGVLDMGGYVEHF